MTRAQINGNWLLRVTDFVPDTSTPLPPRRLVNWSIRFTSGLVDGQILTGIDPSPAPAGLAYTDSRGPSTPIGGGTVSTLLAGNALRPTVAPDLGIGPGISVAADNTLGAYSPNQGRIYLAYTTRGSDPTNPVDNTDIALIYSDDGGMSWAGGATVNDDNALTDGFSEEYTDPLRGPLSGRPQFEPTVAVDQATGTVVVTYYDARYDAARNRVAQMMTTSIDGGNTFAASTFLNRPNAPLDAVTGKNVNIEPIPENQGSGNLSRDALYSFGDRQGLAVAGGHVYSVWASNENGGDIGTINDFENPPVPLGLLDIRTTIATIAAGPRVVSTTMGPVGQPGDLLNDKRGADGGPEASSVIVTFDRPVDPSTFTPGPALPENVTAQFTFEGATPLAGWTIDNSSVDGINGTVDDGLW